MSQPTPYNRAADFSEYQAAHPAAPFNGADADAEFDAIETTVDAILVNLALVQSDSGGLVNSIVTVPALAAEVLALMASGTWTVRGSWSTAISYALGDVVLTGGLLYLCTIAHTSGVFATDSAAGKWGRITASPAAVAISFTPTATLSAITVQGAIEELDTELRAPFSLLQNITTNRLIGRDTVGTGDPEQITVGGGLEFTGTLGLQTSALTGNVTKAAGGTVTTIPAGTVTLAMQANIATDKLIGRDTAGTGVPEAIGVGGGIEFTGTGELQTSALTGDVTKDAGGTAMTIPAGRVTFEKIQDITAEKLLGRGAGGGAGETEEITLGSNLTMSGTTMNVTGVGTAPTTQTRAENDLILRLFALSVDKSRAYQSYVQY